MRSQVKISKLAIVLFFASLLAVETNAKIYINEVMPANTTSFIDPTYNFSAWAELYNDGTTAQNISGWFVTNTMGQPKMFSIANNTSVPAKGYSIVWFGHNDLSAAQADFKLDCDGDSLIILDSNGAVQDKIAYPKAIKGTSYARTADGGTSWGICSKPTYMATNSKGIYCTQRCPAPVADKSGRLFTSSINVKVTIPYGYTLRYTTYCGEPTDTSAVSTTGAFNFSKTTILRMKLFKDGYIPSPTVTNSYILKTRDFTLPVVSVVTNPLYLYDNTLGIYVTGTNGKAGNGSDTPRNWNQDWSRPTNIEYFALSSDTSSISQEGDMSISGGWSRGWNQDNGEKPFKINGDKKFEDKNRFDYSFFKQKPNIRVKTLYLRNSGNDNIYNAYNGTMIKDASLQSTLDNMDIEHQSYQPVVHYINGKYFGIINLRECNNKQYVYSNFGYDNEDIDFFEMNPNDTYVQMEGTKDAYNELYNLCKSASLSATYEEIKKRLDIDEFVNYMAIELYGDNWDWPQNNVKAFRNRNNGKFRFIIYDLDGIDNPSDDTFSKFANKQVYTFDSGAKEEIMLVTMFLNLLKNNDFKKQFVDAYCIVGGSVFEPNYASSCIDSIANIVKTEMTYHVQRWLGTSGWNSYTNYNFSNQLTTLKNILVQRPNYAYSQIKSYMGLSSDAQSVTLSTDKTGAKLFINNLPVPRSKFTGKLFLPVTLKAVAPAGYKFEGWLPKNLVTNAVFDNASTWSYYDKGSLDGLPTWKTLDFDASSWSSGQAPLGYGNTSVATTVSYGSDSNNKNPTTYFRKHFNLDYAPSSDDTYVLNMNVDDGALVYINGTEVGRYLLNTGTVTYNNYATTYASSNPDKTSMNISPSLLVKGDNVIAVEVHQNSATSSDIYLDAQLVTSHSDNSSNGKYYSKNAEITLSSAGVYNYTACFAEDGGQNINSVPVRINEVSAANSIYVNEYFKVNDWLELYNTTDSPVDLAGMYLSNDATNLYKYQIPSGESSITTIPAHGFKIVWCDKSVDFTQLHVNFKLDADGGKIILTSDNSENAWNDVFKYNRHTGDLSEGRYPDGSDSIYLFNRTSIGKENIYSTYNSSLGYLLTAISNMSDDSDKGGASWILRYDNTANNIVATLNSTSEIADVKPTFTLLSLTGQQIMQKRLSGISTEIIPLTGVHSGCYIAVLRDAKGHRTVCKFVKSEKK